MLVGRRKRGGYRAIFTVDTERLVNVLKMFITERKIVDVLVYKTNSLGTI